MPQIPTIEEAKNYIYQIDFSEIVKNMVDRSGWIEIDAKKTATLYRNYLFLNKKYKDKYVIIPSKDIDDFWHHHILDTKRYKLDCKNIFPEFFHHDPNFEIKEKNTESISDHFKITQQLHMQEFGYLIYPTRSRYQSFLYYLLKKIEH